ncbi:STAS/SEC14 domain-containing protein [Ramlibacter sp. MMS24-I3-19]|uniref:STAS/SEC14 domain-containing protein n=1 Tax=Ramlibacter sp. MMS24-I3-19 TaxID=3416606 RepID=UPI003D060797
MALSFTLHDNAHYLHCETAGPATFADMRAGVDLAKTLATNRGQRRILVDMRHVQHALPFSEHLQLGAYAAEAFNAMERVASVVPRETLVGVAAKAAQKLGLQLRTFDDFDAASAWLQS